MLASLASMPIGSAPPATHIYSVAASTTTVAHTPISEALPTLEPPKRRFTEEKEDKIPDSLLGYQVMGT